MFFGNLFYANLRLDYSVIATVCLMWEILLSSLLFKMRLLTGLFSERMVTTVNAPSKTTLVVNRGFRRVWIGVSVAFGVFLMFILIDRVFCFFG